MDEESTAVLGLWRQRVDQESTGVLGLWERAGPTTKIFIVLCRRYILCGGRLVAAVY